jgi:predicted SpoU family rRNA methylase
MTINQAIDKLIEKGSLNKEQKKLKDSLTKFKTQFGGNTKIENTEQVNKIIEQDSKK